MDNQSQLDGVTALCAVGGAIAAAVTNSTAAAAFPLAGAVMLQMVNRRRLMDEMNNHGQHVTKEMVQSINTTHQQQNQFNLSLIDHQKQVHLFSEQLQQQKQDHLRHLESQSAEMGQLQTLLDELQQFTQNIATQHQELSNVVGELKQIENVSHALLNSQNSFEMYYERALSYQRLGDEDAAIADFSNAIQLNPHYAKAYHMRGLLKANLGERRAAVSDLRYAAKYYFESGDLESYQETRSLSKEFCDESSATEIEAPTITQETFDPITASHLFDVN